MIEAWKKVHWGMVFLLALSFWTSGVFLIRALGTYDVWSGGVLLLLLYVFTIPLVLISIVSVRKLIHVNTSQKEGEGAVLLITALVLIGHAVALTVYPSLYGFDSNPALNAVAWLLWFGGVAALTISSVKEF